MVVTNESRTDVDIAIMQGEQTLVLSTHGDHCTASIKAGDKKQDLDFPVEGHLISDIAAGGKGVGLDAVLEKYVPAELGEIRNTFSDREIQELEKKGEEIKRMVGAFVSNKRNPSL